MEVFEAIRTLLAVRSYRDEPVPDEVIHKVLEAARLSGSSRNRQEWAFVVVREPERLKRLAQLTPTGPYIAEAAFAVAILVPDKTIGRVDGARAAQDMMLAAWGQGVGSNWVGFPESAALREFLAVPQGWSVLAAIPFGYPTARLGRGKKSRKPPAEVAFVERYGQPYRG